jgi:phosphoadenylyl-sulfate reductase (thioredoxin)
MSTSTASLDVERSAAELEEATAEQILGWAAGRLPRVAFSTGFGAEGCVLIHLIASAQLPIDIFTLDTGLLFPETYALWTELEQKYGITIRAVRPEHTVEEQAVRFGPALWSRSPDECCRMRKLEPLARALEGADGWITAIRRDQTAERATAPVIERDRRYGVLKINPLVRWTSKDVWRYLHAHDVPYNPLHDAGYPSIGCQPCTTAVAEGEDPRAGRWRGQAKRECGLHLK